MRGLFGDVVKLPFHSKAVIIDVEFFQSQQHFCAFLTVILLLFHTFMYIAHTFCRNPVYRSVSVFIDYSFKGCKAKINTVTDAHNRF
jgi:hypothetical protein